MSLPASTTRSLGEISQCRNDEDMQDCRQSVILEVRTCKRSIRFASLYELYGRSSRLTHALLRYQAATQNQAATPTPMRAVTIRSQACIAPGCQDVHAIIAAVASSRTFDGSIHTGL